MMFPGMMIKNVFSNKVNVAMTTPPVGSHVSGNMMMIVKKVRML